MYMMDVYVYMNNSKRIIKDITTVQNLPVTDHIYIFIVDDKDIKNLRAIILGPTDSPYVGGIFLFNIQIPDIYPYVPPVILHTTTCERIHPNLYASPDGKVCLSILNTWGKHEWASSLTFEVILRTIQSLLDKNPITFEPGFEHYDLIKGHAYEMCARWITIKSTLNILKTLDKYPDNMQIFIRKNMPYIIDNISQSISKLHDDTYNTIHHHNIKVSRQAMETQLIQITSNINAK